MFLASSGWAQSKRVLVNPLDPVTVKQGGSVSQIARVVVQAGSHVNSDKPRNEFLIPLHLEWEPGALAAVAIHYPDAEEIQVGADKLLVYTGSFGIRTDFKVLPNAIPGTSELKGKLHFQACNNQMCFRPATVDVSLSVTIR